MSINVFEGGRRIRTILAAIIFLVCIWNLFWGGGTPSISLKTDYPGQAFRVVEKCGENDHSSYESYQDVDGTTVSFDVCFKGEKDKTIAYKDVPGKPGFVLMGNPYEEEPAAYIESRIAGVGDGKQFDHNTVLAAVNAENRKQFKERIWQSFRFLVGFLAVLYGLTWCIGWVVRGFAGIPGGMDRKPVRPVDSDGDSATVTN